MWNRCRGSEEDAAALAHSLRSVLAEVVLVLQSSSGQAAGLDVDPFQLSYSILWMCMEVPCDGDGGLLRLLSTFVLQLLVFGVFVLSESQIITV